MAGDSLISVGKENSLNHSQSHSDGISHELFGTHFDHRVEQQCRFVASVSGSRCPNRPTSSAFSGNKEGFCESHLRLSGYLKKRAALLRRYRNKAVTPLAKVKSILSSIAEQTPNEIGDSVSKEWGKKSLDLYSESSDEDGGINLQDCLDTEDDYDLNQLDDPLRHAGVYTAEEIIRISLEKMIRLRALYLDHLNLLNDKYRSQRPSKSVGLIKNFSTNPKTMAKFKALRKYRKLSGQNILLKEKSRHLRQMLEKVDEKEDVEKSATCDFVEASGMNCSNERMPESVFCSVHILEDRRQILFTKCSSENCGSIIVSPNRFCHFHTG